MLIKHIRIPLKHIIFIGLLPSSIKKVYYRLKGYKIGKNVKIGFGSILNCKEVIIGDNCKISFGVIITVDKFVIGKNVKIGTGSFIDTREVYLDDDVIIGEMVGVGGIKNEKSLLKVGKRAHIFPYSLINPTLPIILGDDSSFGYANYVFTHASWKSSLEGYPVVFAPITIGKGVWLPSRVQIFPGVGIGDNAVIGAGSIVTTDIPERCFAMGSPAKVVKENYPTPLSTDERDEKIREVFNGFEKHMQYHGFSIESNETENGIEYTVRNKKNSYQIWFCKNKLALPELNKKSLIIFDNDENLHTYHQNKNTMLLNLKSKERLGTTSIGEEFVRFISRFGIRFNRLD